MGLPFFSQFFWPRLRHTAPETGAILKRSSPPLVTSSVGRGRARTLPLKLTHVVASGTRPVIRMPASRPSPYISPPVVLFLEIISARFAGYPFHFRYFLALLPWGLPFEFYSDGLLASSSPTSQLTSVSLSSRAKSFRVFGSLWFPRALIFPLNVSNHPRDIFFAFR